MARTIDKSKRLELFSKIKSAILNNDTLARRFHDDNFYEFEPALNSLTFKHIPYIVINIPLTDTNDSLQTLDHSIVGKDFTVTIMLVMDYEARDKFKDYANKLMKEIEAKEKDFKYDGFFDLEIDLVGAPVELLERKKVVSGEFRLTFNGAVDR